MKKNFIIFLFFILSFLFTLSAMKVAFVSAVDCGKGYYPGHDNRCHKSGGGGGGGTVNYTPIGNLDGNSGSTSDCRAVGWTCESNAPNQSLTVHFYDSGTFLGTTSANMTGEAAIGTLCGGTSNHRFSFNLPSSIAGASHSIYAYAIGVNASGVDSNVNPLLSSAPKTINCNATQGDTNGDGVVNFLDYFYYVSARYGGGVPTGVNADLNKDGVVDDKDRQILIPPLLKILSSQVN